MTNKRQVAIIVDSSNPYQRKILLGVGAYRREVGNWSLYLEDELMSRLPNLKRWRGDGILVTFKYLKTVIASCLPGIPIVGIEGGSGWSDIAPRTPYFATDNRAVGRLGAEHLMNQGFRRLGYCGLPPTGRTSWADERAVAFRQRAKEARVPCCSFAGSHAMTQEWAGLQHELEAWLTSIEKPVGILAANDARARHVLEACHSVGLRVPEDVAILGVSNDAIVCELTDPSLSSIEQGAYVLGYQAATLLDRMMDGRKPRSMRHLIKPVEVITRRSTSILAIEDADVAAAVRFIREHACDPISVSQVIEAGAVSRSSLVARFKAIMGRTIHAEIQRMQVEMARHLIATSQLPLKQVASTAGFVHVNYMTTVFREHTGWTPAEYRKHAQL